ncbi:MAG: response regulator [Desulfobacterales bacterium]|nr:response regulator [Desulfobacterales bacterium]
MFILILTSCSNISLPPPTVKEGILDLTNWNFKHNRVISLNGEWEFYWKKLLTPSDFKIESSKEPKDYIIVPSIWNGYNLKNTKLTGFGYATYRVKVLLDDYYDNLSFKMDDVGTAYTIYVNGKKIHDVGKVGTTRDNSSPRYFPCIVDIKNNEKFLDIIINLSNFHHRKGGLWSSITLGFHNDIYKIREHAVAFDVFLVGSLLIMGFYHIGLFIVRRKDRSTLYFGTFCFLFSLRILLTNDMFFIYIFPGIKWEFQVKLEYLSFYMALPIFLMFVQSIFKNQFSKLIDYIVKPLSIIFSIFVIVTPVRFFSHTLICFQILTFITSIYMLYVLFKASLSKKKDASIFVTGFIILFFSIINDILSNHLILSTIYLAPFGFFIFIFFQASIISFRFSKAFHTAETMEAKFRQIFENTVEGIFQISPDGFFISANPSMAKILGYESVKELLEVNIKNQTDFTEALKKEGQIIGYEFHGIRKNNKIFWASVSVRSVFDDKGKIIYYEGSMIDITERKEKERAERDEQTAKAATEAKSAFLANMSHEIRTPMNAVIGFTELAIRTDIIDKKQDYLTKIKTSAKTLLGIINDILDFSKIEAGKLSLEYSNFDLQEVMDNIYDMFINKAYEKSISLNISISNDIPSLLTGDPLRLNQVLVNLINNALKFTKEGEIHISLKAEEFFSDNKVKLCFSVKDTGIGISIDQLNKLFEPFVQADTSITRKYGGTGLGLSISKALVELMGGKIWAESEVSKGSSFYFNAIFGVQENNKKIVSSLRLKTDKSKESVKSLKGIQILLVEDNTFNQQIASELLKSKGIFVSVADNGVAGLNMIKKSKFDVILMDIQMPEMDGYETTIAIREWEKDKNCKTPIIAMTANMTEDREKCFEVGMDDYVTKPIDPDYLLETIQKWVKND